MLEQARTIRAGLEQDDGLAMAKVLVILGLVEAKQGELEPAIADIERGLAIYEAELHPRHPLLVQPLNDSGDALRTLGRPAEALARHRRAAAILEQTDPDSRELTRTYFRIGQARLDLGEHELALTELERAHERWLGHGGKDADLARTRFALARALRATGGDPERARTLATEARDLFAAAGISTQDDLREVERWLADG